MTTPPVITLAAAKAMNSLAGQHDPVRIIDLVDVEEVDQHGLHCCIEIRLHGLKWTRIDWRGDGRFHETAANCLSIVRYDLGYRGPVTFEIAPL